MKKISLICLLTLLSYFSANATTYYSTTTGDWTAAIWSTVGHSETTGLVSLPCVFTGNDQVRVAHDISSSCGLLDLGTFAGTTEIIIDQGASFTINGDIDMKGTHMTYVQPSSFLTINGNLNMSGTSDIIIDGNLLVNGDVNMTGNSQVCGNGLAVYTGTLNLSGNAIWCSSLPIELLSFDATLHNKHSIELTWTTESETNNDFFTIERSTDGDLFEAIGQVKGAGTTQETMHYSFIDKPIQNLIYYRIKQTDFDGTFNYTKTIAIDNKYTSQTTELPIYPNPVEGNGFYINLNLMPFDGIAKLCNINGIVIQQQSITLNDNLLYFDTQNLPQGIYMVVIYTEKNTTTQKVLVQ